MKLRDILLTREEIDNTPAKDRDRIQCLKLINILIDKMESENDCYWIDEIEWEEIIDAITKGTQ